MSPLLRLVPYTPDRCREMAELFLQTIYTVNAADYSPRLLDAWASGAADLAAWDRSFRAHVTLLAEEEGVLTGFGDLDRSGYLDRLYVHRDFQRRGVATALCDGLEDAVEGERVLTHASLTAKPFFLRRGYRVIREQQVLRRGVALTNFVMEKRLAPPALRTAARPAIP